MVQCHRSSDNLFFVPLRVYLPKQCIGRLQRTQNCQYKKNEKGGNQTISLGNWDLYVYGIVWVFQLPSSSCYGREYIANVQSSNALPCTYSYYFINYRYYCPNAIDLQTL